jgi:hypothetical protein
MQSYQLLNHQLQALLQLLHQLKGAAYIQKSVMLGEVSIGQHMRHIIELAQCLVNGYDDGSINYDARKRDLRMETDPHFAVSCIEQLLNKTSRNDKALLLLQDNNPVKAIHTFYYREVMYNTEHAIHHMALIKVALREMQLDIVDTNFGVAPATIQYRQQQCAQ